MPDGADEALQAQLRERIAAAASIEGVGVASPLLPSAVGAEGGPPRAFQAFVPIDGSPAEVVAEVRASLDALPGGAIAYVTGPAGFVADLVEAFGEIDGILLVVTVVSVLLILLVVYRSPVLPLLVLLSAVGALANAVVAVYFMAKWGWIKLNGQAQGILFILVIGAATDYALLLVSRFREALRAEASVVAAIRRAWRGAFEPILASGGTVIGGVLVLLISDLTSDQALGPVAAVGIAVAMFASLTFLPALLALFGRGAFFPFPPRLASSAVRASPVVHTKGFWVRVADLVGRRPRYVWVTTTVALGVAAAFAPAFDARGVAQTEFVLGATESRAGQDVLARYFEAGTGDPVVVIGDAAQAETLLAVVEGVDGIASAALTRAGFAGPPSAEAGRGSAEARAPSARPVLVASVDGRDLVEVRATLAVAPDSDAAIAVVGELRTAVRAVDPTAAVGGSTATDLDTRATARADLWRIIPLVLVVITLMLMLLLRSVLAPLLLMATNVLSYFATLGVGGWSSSGCSGCRGRTPWCRSSRSCSWWRSRSTTASS
ncbi:MAG: efflux RND transporter permease subunit [Trueperaceae bacterium]|nr:efflux RND transporter permease subunit [Trueperaceae bacterium]